MPLKLPNHEPLAVAVAGETGNSVHDLVFTGIGLDCTLWHSFRSRVTESSVWGMNMFAAGWRRRALLLQQPVCVPLNVAKDLLKHVTVGLPHSTSRRRTISGTAARKLVMSMRVSFGATPGIADIAIHMPTAQGCH